MNFPWGAVSYWLQAGRIDAEEREGSGLEGGRGGHQWEGVSLVDSGGHPVQRAGGQIAQQALEGLGPRREKLNIWFYLRLGRSQSRPDPVTATRQLPYSVAVVNGSPVRELRLIPRGNPAMRPRPASQGSKNATTGG